MGSALVANISPHLTPAFPESWNCEGSRARRLLGATPQFSVDHCIGCATCTPWFRYLLSLSVLLGDATLTALNMTKEAARVGRGRNLVAISISRHTFSSMGSRHPCIVHVCFEVCMNLTCTSTSTRGTQGCVVATMGSNIEKVGCSRGY